MASHLRRFMMLIPFRVCTTLYCCFLMEVTVGRWKIRHCTGMLKCLQNTIHELGSPTVKWARRELIHIHLGHWIGSNESNFETHLGASLKWKPRSQGLLELNCHLKTVGHLPLNKCLMAIRKHLNNFDNFDIPNGESMNRLLEDHQAEIHPPKCNVDILDNMDTKILPGAGLCRVPWGNRVEIWSSPKKQRVNERICPLKNVVPFQNF